MPEFVYIESKSFKFSSKNDIICLPKHILSLSEVEQIRARNFVELVRTIYLENIKLVDKERTCPVKYRLAAIKEAIKLKEAMEPDIASFVEKNLVPSKKKSKILSKVKPRLYTSLDEIEGNVPEGIFSSE